MSNSTQTNVLDPDYGKNGVAYPHSAISTIAASVPCKEDWICVGTSGGFGYVLFRVNSRGELDTTFGDDNGLTRGSFKPGFNADGRGVQLLSDGRILITGLHHQELTSLPALARFTAEGLLDKGFGDNGHIILEQPPVEKNISASSASANALPGNNKPVTLNNVQGQTNLHTLLANDKIYLTYKFPRSNSVIFRFDVDGNPDTSFNSTGHKYLSPPLGLDTYAGAIQLDGDKILLCGSSSNGTKTSACVIRLDSEGNEDQGFGEGGYAFAKFNFDAQFSAITKHSEAKTLCAGFTLDAPQKGVIAAFTGSGAPLTGFESEPTDFGRLGGAWLGVGTLSSSHIIALGNTFGGDEADVVIGRYQLDGKPDTDFGDGNGWARIALGNSIDMAFDMEVLSDDKTLVLGSDFELPDDASWQRTGFLLRCLTKP